MFTANQMSDGTLRFLCLTTLLLSPDRPRCIVLDEPELGLHPFAIHKLAGLLRAATAGSRQCVVATQSAQLIDEFELADVAVLGRHAGATTVTRPDAQHLRAFLDEYSLGELWRMNMIGGRPSSETAVA